MALAKAINPKFNPDDEESETAYETVANYNDGDSRRRYQVLAAFDRAIDSLKK